MLSEPSVRVPAPAGAASSVCVVPVNALALPLFLHNALPPFRPTNDQSYDETTPPLLT
jgi:hypothetical protein